MYSKPSQVEIWDLMGKLAFALGSGWIIVPVFKNMSGTKRCLAGTKRLWCVCACGLCCC